MFNRGGFNRLPFNRPTELEISISIAFNGVGESSLKANMEFSSILTLSGEGSLSLSAIRELFNSIQMDGVGELSMDSIRERFASIVMNGLGSLSINASKYHIDSFEYTGDYNPGDRIEIDSKKLRILKNGVNVSGLTEGDPFMLNTGINNITYTDEETGRSVLFRISYRDKFLY